MDLELRGKSAIVTGASRGIGRAIAEALAREGVRVLLVARNAEQLSENVRRISSAGGEAHALALDLRGADAADQCIAQAVRLWGGLDILVNNAGDTKRGNFFELTDQDWERGFSLKFYSYMRLSRSAWPQLRSRSGAIVNIIGSNANAGHAVFTIGGAVNSAVANLTKSLSDIGISDGVRVNAINPGPITGDRLDSRIDYVAKISNLERSAAINKILSDSHVSRFGEPEEVANAVVFLVSSKASYIQGALLDIDGGLNRSV